jgi:lipoprotein NlpI
MNLDRRFKFLLALALGLGLTVPGFGATVENLYQSGLDKMAKKDLDGAIADFSTAIALRPDAGGAYLNRGLAQKDKGDLDAALADLNQAVRLKPKESIVYEARGVVKRRQNDFAGALLDFSKAIEVQPKDELGYLYRGTLRGATSDLDGALADLNKALELKPDDDAAWKNRGNVRYILRDFTGARADLLRAIELNAFAHDTEVARYWLWLVRARQGEAAAATGELQAYLPTRIAGRPGDWSSRIGQYLTSQLTELDFISAAKNSDLKDSAGHLCEAWFYVGSKHLFAGEKSVAVDDFQKALDTGKSNYREYIAAAAELKFLQAGKVDSIRP